MRCSKAQKLISLRLDARVPPRSAERLELHLARCPSCRLAAERLEHAWRALGTAGRPGPAPDDWSAIEAAVETRSRRWVAGWLELDLVPTRAVTTCALAVMTLLGGAGGLVLGRSLHQPRPASVETMVIAETLGALPWNSPVSGLDRSLDVRDAEGRP